MKKMIRIAAIALGAIVGILLLTVLILYVQGTCRQKFTGADESLAAWMYHIDDDALLRQVAIPGSHDAGTAGVLWPGETQTYSIGEQLLSGARYFDLRVHKKDGRYVIYHDVLDGVDFTGVLGEIRDFIASHPTEILLLDFQHFKGGSQQDVAALLEDALLADGLLLQNTTGMSDFAFLHQLTVGEARGRCIVFWGDRSADPADWIFLRNNDDCSAEWMSLDSYYIGEYHKSTTGTLIGEAFPIYFAKLAERKEWEENAIFVLQCQLTDGRVIFGPWSRERGHDPKISAYIRSLADAPELTDINVILRDFLTPEKCAEIVALNRAKGIWTE